MRVLILEQERLAAEQVAQCVEASGHSVAAFVTTVAEALSAAARSRPDLLVADIDLGPGGDGAMVAAVLRTRQNIKTIFVTAHVDPVSRDRAQHAWPIAFLAKPFGPGELMRLLTMAEALIRINPAFPAAPPERPRLTPLPRPDALPRANERIRMRGAHG